MFWDGGKGSNFDRFVDSGEGWQGKESGDSVAVWCCGYVCLSKVIESVCRAVGAFGFEG